jgi:hypothetical protein
MWVGPIVKAGENSHMQYQIAILIRNMNVAVETTILQILRDMNGYFRITEFLSLLRYAVCA